MPEKEVEDKFSEPEPLPPKEQLEEVHEEAGREQKLRKLLKSRRKR